MKLIGVGKSQHINYLGNWTNSNDASVCADMNGNPTWNNWDANQRDLFVLNHEGDIALYQNITSGLPDNLETLLIDLINEASNDCNPELACAEVLTCCDGLLYPTSCCLDNCDEPIEVSNGMCDDENECIDGEVNNDNPCNPMECYNGQWVEMIIDCAEQTGVPCEGGLYVAPPEGVCCSTCIQYGDTNGDSTLNVLDVVVMVNLVINNIYNQVADINTDGAVNVLDVVSLVGIIIQFE